WGNLHGVAVVGLVLAATYLLVDRARREPALACWVLIASAAALFLNPALLETGAYYRAVFRNEAAAQGFGLWAPLRPTLFDGLLVASAVVLLVLAWRGRPRLWEWVAVAGLAVGTVRAERLGIWLLLVVCYPAARGLAPRGVNVRVLGCGIAVVLAAGVVAFAHRPADGSATLVQRTASSGRVVLADASVAELVAADGGRVWLANPIDAFARGDQRLYLA